MYSTLLTDNNYFLYSPQQAMLPTTNNYNYIHVYTCTCIVLY